MKSKFFANISHEFRTPLTLILSPLEEKLSSASLARADRESLQLVTRNASRLLSLVNQLLELSKLERKKNGTDSTGGRFEHIPFSCNGFV